MTEINNDETREVLSQGDFIEEYADTIRKAARKVLKIKGYLELDDLIQEGWLKVLPKWEILHEKGGHGLVYARAVEGMTAALYRELRGYEYFSGKFVYTPELVRAQLENGVWDGTPEGDWDIRLDVRAALETLAPERQWEVEQCYKLGISTSSPEFEGSKQRLSESIARMANALNQGATRHASELDRVKAGL